MKTRLAFVVGAGVGYVLGTRAGRGQFEKIKTMAKDVWQDPRVQQQVTEFEGAASRFAKEQGTALKDKAVDAVKAYTPGSRGNGTSDAETGEDAASTTYTPPSTTGTYTPPSTGSQGGL
jgi:hypothetical protein